eukprot:361615-Chlamydomonas_euryale.AAC.2
MDIHVHTHGSDSLGGLIRLPDLHTRRGKTRSVALCNHVLRTAGAAPCTAPQGTVPGWHGQGSHVPA